MNILDFEINEYLTMIFLIITPWMENLKINISFKLQLSIMVIRLLKINYSYNKIRKSLDYKSLNYGRLSNFLNNMFASDAHKIIFVS